MGRPYAWKQVRQARLSYSKTTAHQMIAQLFLLSASHYQRSLPTQGNFVHPTQHLLVNDFFPQISTGLKNQSHGCALLVPDV